MTDNLDRPTRLRLVHEAMLAGMLLNRALLPQPVLRTGGFDIMNEVAIDLWMGASPVYTQRTRALMGITGDDVAAIMKTLQLDVGFVHQYMDVAYRVHDARSGEFWLNHCGALLDAEPFGEERVFGMCHTIEDPTFDATALAVNPRARIRPIHRPPRQPADRHPHCHWTITIDPAADPVGPARLTEEVGALPLASVPNPAPADRGSDGRTDYAGDFDPSFRLADLATPMLGAIESEFVAQTHLLAASGELALALRFGADDAREMLARAWAGVGWTVAERLAAALGLDPGPGAAGVAATFAHQPLLPPGCTRSVSVDGDAVELVLTETHPGTLDPGHPGLAGLLARRDPGGLTAMAQAVDPRARLVELDGDADRVTAVFTVRPGTEPTPPPGEVALMDSIASRWHFTLGD